MLLKYTTKQRLFTTFSIAAAVLLTLLFVSPAIAADDAKRTFSLESVTVTANKVEEDMNDVPQSITVIYDDVLKEKGIEGIGDVINEIPNMNFRSGYDEGVNFRGLNKSMFTSNNPVIIYVDGIAYSNTNGFNVSLINVERIEVLRGPQGTLFGKDAIGGVINVVTKKPENEWHGNIGTEYGSYNNIQGSYNINGPLIKDKLFLGINSRYQQDDGWITNDYTDDDKVNRRDNYNLGGTLFFTPNRRLSAKVVLLKDHYYINGVSAYGLPPGTDISEFNRDDAENMSFDKKSYSETNSFAQSVQLKYEFDSMTVSSTTSHRDVNFKSINDRDAMAGTRHDGTVAFDDTDIETWGEELRLSSNNTKGVRWVAGVYFDTEDMEKSPYGIQSNRSGTIYAMNFESETESETKAMFGQAMIPLGKRFELTFGARYQRIEKSMDLNMYNSPVGVSGSPIYSLDADETWEVFLPKAAFSFKVNDKWTAYTSIAQGYMPGGFNFTAYSGSEKDNTFEPQRSTNYEIGVKGELNRGRLTFNIFYMDIEDIHIFKYDKAASLYITDNAGGAHSLGTELDLTYLLTDSIELTAALGIIDAEYDDYDTGNAVYKGESIENTPSRTAQVGVAYFHPSGVYARGDLKHKGKVPYLDTIKQKFGEMDDYILADLRIGYRINRFDIYAYCYNLTDEEYITNFTSSNIKAAADFGDPRTFGIGVRYTF